MEEMEINKLIRELASGKLNFQEEAACVGTFLNFGVPLSALILIRLDENKEWIECAKWGWEENLCASLESFLKEFLPEMIKTFEKRERFTKEQLLDTIRDFDCAIYLEAPELAPVYYKNEVLGILFVDKRHRTEDWLKEEAELLEEVNSLLALTLYNRKCEEEKEMYRKQILDITDPIRLSLTSMVDELTNVLNRRAGKEALTRTLTVAKKEGVTLTVALYDINVLKGTNDTYGHIEGDRMITLIADGVKGQLNKRDFIFRLGGDEFVVGFYNKSIKKVTKTMQKVLEQLKMKQEELLLPYELSFCFGVVEIKPQMNISISEIIMQADEKMYEQKKRFHIEKAEEKRLLMANKSSKELQFEYDKEHLYDALVQSTDDYIYVCNMKTDTFRYPRAMVEEFNLPSEVIQNAAAIWGAKVHEHDKPAFLESNQDIADGRTDSHWVEYRAKNRKGEWVWLRCRGHLERDENGEPSLFAGIITNLGKKNKIDHLTGMFNKFEFENQITHQIGEESVNRLDIILLGMDEFHRINDLFDRVFGDEVLRITAQKIQAVLPSNAILYRLDGDEFGIAVINGEQNDIKRIFMSIQNIFKHQQHYNGKQYYSTISGGSASYPKDADNYLDLFKYAGYALQSSKKQGKNRITVFSNRILEQKGRSLQIFEAVREQIEKDMEGFELYYQSVVRTMDGKAVGAEALSRLQCEKYGNIEPGEFIPILEQTSYIMPFGRWVFQKVVEQCKKWVLKDEDFVISINFSYTQLTKPDFISFIEQTLQENQLEPSHIMIELQESSLVQEKDTIYRIFNELRRIGLKVALDNFGSGYSNVKFLKNFPIDVVKVGRSFIKDVENSNFDATFLRFIVELCHDVNIKVCTTGIEDKEEFKKIGDMNPDFIQGFLFGKPVPAGEFERNMY